MQIDLALIYHLTVLYNVFCMAHEISILTIIEFESVHILIVDIVME